MAREHDAAGSGAVRGRKGRQQVGLVAILVVHEGRADAQGLKSFHDVVDQGKVAVPAGGVEADQLRDFSHGRFAGCV